MTKMPDAKSLQLTQRHLLDGTLQPRHVDKMLQHDDATRQLVASLVHCSTAYADAQQRLLARAHTGGAEPHELQRAQQRIATKNLLCLCSAACPDQTHEWTDCVRNARKAAAKSSCEAQRLRLEQCTQRQTALLLGAIMAPARSKLDELSQPQL